MFHKLKNFSLFITLLVISCLIACDDDASSEQDDEVLSIGGTEMAGSDMTQGTGLSGTEMAE